MAIGKAVRRVDAVAKVTGRARYTEDFFRPGMLKAKYLRSTIASGRVKKIDASRAKRLPGVEAVFTYEDVPQINYATAGHPYSLDPSHRDVEDRLLLTRQVRYWGDEIAVVVAENELILQQAIKLIVVDYEESKPLLTPEDSLAEGAREMIAEGHHREAMMWILLGYFTAMGALENDAPAAEKQQHLAAFGGLMRELGLGSPDAWRAGVEATRAFAEECFTLAEYMIEFHPDIWD